MIDREKLLEKLATIAHLAKSDPQKALLGRVIYIVENTPTVDAVPLKPLARFLAEYAAAPFVKLTDLADREKHVKRWEEFLRGIDWSADDDLQ